MPAARAPLIVVASPLAGVADEIAHRLKQDGAIAYATHSAAGCLRVATSVRPDIVLLDPALPSRLHRLLKAHPASSQARVLHLTRAGVDATRRSLGGRRTPIAAA
jgi:DNA-binding response OmpR family regulator